MLEFDVIIISLSARIRQWTLQSSHLTTTSYREDLFKDVVKVISKRTARLYLHIPSVCPICQFTRAGNSRGMMVIGRGQIDLLIKLCLVVWSRLKSRGS